ncbi:type IV pilin protein [Simiduia agarivorans]|uniref:Type 4 fimbrial biogenesis protein PilE n=1 Tax=Simiduia agarivorans (strain DSM 21679 / JCM 13881 / BCRC 17597 / SA1) TaxID=1117647 RepID=K4KL04_SIMAS|nr:type IV pilin protein [Simiduia agarivorans]AFU98915.1 type 4 fimbrial biogenesis protein PilE [Simiduia agarivorans SA1 = DSM 21679]
MKRYESGFTLIELMMVVAVVAVLVAVAIPAYNDQVTKARRSDAKTSIMELVSRQERFYTQYLSYTKTLVGPNGCSGTACGLNMASDKSTEGFYTLSVTTSPNGCAPATNSLCRGFEITATPVATDEKCKTLTINHIGVQKATGTESADYCWR